MQYVLPPDKERTSSERRQHDAAKGNMGFRRLVVYGTVTLMV